MDFTEWLGITNEQTFIFCSSALSTVVSVLSLVTLNLRSQFLYKKFYKNKCVLPKADVPAVYMSRLAHVLLFVLPVCKHPHGWGCVECLERWSSSRVSCSNWTFTCPSSCSVITIEQTFIFQCSGALSTLRRRRYVVTWTWEVSVLHKEVYKNVSSLELKFQPFISWLTILHTFFVLPVCKHPHGWRVRWHVR